MNAGETSPPWHMTLERPRGISPRELDLFTIRAEKQRRLLERLHGVAVKARWETPPVAAPRPTRVILHFEPCAPDDSSTSS